MKVLVVSPHADDETLGAGGSILKHKAEGDQVFWLNMCTLKENFGYALELVIERREQVEKICDAYSLDGYIDFELEPACLDVYPRNELIKRMGQAMTRIAPDVVILPHRGDIHSDHRIAFEVVMACTKVFRYPSIKRIMSMEILSETDFADPAEVFCADYFVDISDYLEKKIEIMRIYSSELGTHPFPRNENSIRASALLHGITAGVEYAEAFHIIKIIEPNYLICQEI